MTEEKNTPINRPRSTELSNINHDFYMACMRKDDFSIKLAMDDYHHFTKMRSQIKAKEEI